MQLLSRLKFFNTLDNKAEPYSPFQRHIHDIENKRSKLFPDRKRVPGRKTKYIFAIGLVINMWVVMKFNRAKETVRLKEEQQRQIQRKAAPFFQSIEDIQYTIVKHRTDLLMIEAFKNKGGADYLEKKGSRISTNKIWLEPFLEGRIWQKAGTGRYVQQPLQLLKGRYLPGFDIQNI